MLDKVKNYKRKVGLAPGSLEFVGEQKMEHVELTLFEYDKDTVTHAPISSIDEFFEKINPEKIQWLNVYGLHDKTILQKICDKLEIHKLILEDVLNTSHRPKFETFDDCFFLVQKSIEYDPETHALQIEQMSFICKNNLVLCFQEKRGDLFDPVRERIQHPNGLFRRRGADYVVYALSDVLVDRYMAILELVDERMQYLDELLIDHYEEWMLAEIKTIKQALILLRKNTRPLKEAILEFKSGTVVHVREDSIPFINDLYDHVIFVGDTLDTMRELVAGLLELYMTQVNNRMNQVMKVLTIIATIFIPLSFLAGIYGMNFDTTNPLNMPELSLPYGYIVFWILVLGITGTLLGFFKKKKWF